MEWSECDSVTSVNDFYSLGPDSPPQALVAAIEKNQTKLDECQTHSKQYCTSVKVQLPQHFVIVM